MPPPGTSIDFHVLKLLFHRSMHPTDRRGHAPALLFGSYHLHSDAAIDPEGLAGDVGGGGQECHGIRHVLGFAHAAQGD